MGRQNWSVLFVVAVLIIVATIISVHRITQVRNHRLEEFRLVFGSIKGKHLTPGEVVQELGTPYSATLDCNNAIQILVYKETRYGLYCFVTFENNRAKQITFEFQ